MEQGYGEMDTFTETMADRRQDVESRVAAARQEHRAGCLEHAGPLDELMNTITEALSRRWGGELQPQFDSIDRAQFGGDLALKFPQLLRDGGPKGFTLKHQPWIVEELGAPDLAWAIGRVEAAGMYVNVTVTESWLLESTRAIVRAGEDFGAGATMRDRTFVVDYSSPNVAKELHAGHIRSTIVGHVLSNLYSAAGALVHRLNHINDFGGFGYVLEGWRRFGPGFTAESTSNDRLLEIYRLRRVLERAAGGVEPLEDSERKLLQQHLPSLRSPAELRVEFEDYTTAADARFAALAAGDPEEVGLWTSLVDHSLAAFQDFYDALAVEFDFVIGESFYARRGREVVSLAVETGAARVFDAQDADTEIADLRRRREADEITQRELEAAERAVRKDLGATVVALDRGERLVVLRRDGHDIYATRDIGAISLRRDLFDPTDIIYVVGQEQQVHFDRVFRAAETLGLVDRSRTRLEHIYFGFYVDATTGRKLSSRDSAANVMNLLHKSYEHFLTSLSDRATAEADPRSAAQQLAVGSLVFNDLQKDMRTSVDIDSANVDATIAGFEKSGGAYVIYAAVRAGSVISRSKTLPQDEGSGELDHQECRLLMTAQRLPAIVADAAATSEPAVLVRYLKELATLYSSYYARVPVIRDGSVSSRRLLITKAVRVTLRNGLRLCHVEVPAAM